MCIISFGPGFYQGLCFLGRTHVILKTYIFEHEKKGVYGR